jgi:aspartate/methionine/tyrosine aminotransferase
LLDVRLVALLVLVTHPFIFPLFTIFRWVNFSAPTPNQDAIAQSLIKAKEPYEGFSSYYTYLASEYKRKRQLLSDALTAAGMTPVLPPGGFFIMADTSKIDFPLEYLDAVTDAMPVSPMPRDWAMSRWLTTQVGVTAIPPSAFYSKENVPLAKNLLRFAYCKGDDTILEANRRLEAHFGGDKK